ncbi:hypothetical protein PF005_g25291 [Phytophthora fragariae]|uniref:Secreted protein n=1 Tax=Phytophthora fragariae TaxID=53985 RepID=A0A6A3EWN9_9STRA|nr:hypothetical protein PF003_g34192 [Phytophthora fragariae]KAE8936461.1 hypothetical protein PF009_g13607 [Phytophthora fragariae]KAE8975547.1 hypothetical protein PF011_g24419 [Phytophthora fragariae]KAE9073287.1 hypothetical protein PF010_g25128 [Phytophthora fragariae]KAE9073809.1 hypothetical protein PF007_g25663 [Phytophthora fragariae]
MRVARVCVSVTFRLLGWSCSLVRALNNHFGSKRDTTALAVLVYFNRGIQNPRKVCRIVETSQLENRPWAWGAIQHLDCIIRAAITAGF